MGQEVTTPAPDPIAAFQEKVTAKLKADIGSLMPDEVLAGLVERAIKEQFFTPRRIPNPNRGWNSTDTIDAPSWFVEEVGKQAKPMLEAAVARVIVERQPEIEKAIADFLAEQNLMLLAVASMQMHSHSQILTGVEQILQRLRGHG